MNEIKMTLQIMSDSLVQKKELLNSIYEYTIKQEVLLKEDIFEQNLFSELMDKKQVLIDKISVIDSGFQVAFERIQGVLQQHTDLYQEQITLLKQLIKEVGELGISIQVHERRNKLQFENISRISKEKVKTFKKSKQAVSNYYSSMNKQKNSEGTFFFDTKK